MTVEVAANILIGTLVAGPFIALSWGIWRSVR